MPVPINKGAILAAKDQLRNGDKPFHFTTTLNNNILSYTADTTPLISEK